MRNKKLKKRLIVLGVVAVLLAGGIIGGVQYMNYKNDQKTVEVVPMMYVSNTYWGDQTSSSGNIVADYMQELYPDSSKSISEIFVTEGQQVAIGDPLLQYNRESLELDVEAKTIIACIVQAADAISAARPGARRENLENYIKRLEKLEELASSFAGVENCYAIQAGREVRIMIKPEMVSDEQMTLLAREICQKIEAELDYPGQIKVNMIRESRAVDYAK